MVTPALQKEIETLKSRNDNLEDQNKKLQQENERLREELRLALHRKFGKSSEKQESQGDLPFDELTAEVPASEPAAEEAEALPDAKTATKKRGRKPLNPIIPRDHIYHELSESDRTCACGSVMEEMGEEITERLNIIPEQVFVECHHRKKYACRCCGGVEDETRGAVRIAPGEPTILPGSILTPGLLATTLTNKFCDHLPYYRQEQRFARIEVEVSRQDMTNWQMALSSKLDPLMDLLEREIRSGPVIQMDETPVVIQKQEGRKNGSQSYMWFSKGGQDHPTVRYRFGATRESENARKILENFSGYLQTDGYQAYETALKNLPEDRIVHVGCWAHARRKFVDADKSSSSFLTKEALKRIGRIYEVENQLREESLETDAFQNQRIERLLPLMEGFHEWAVTMATRTAPSSATGKALQYLLNQWFLLVRVLDHPDIRLDNNGAENGIRPFVLGRKNWLFSGNPEGAESSCRIFTLIETAKLNGRNPYEYLIYLITNLLLVTTPADWVNLLPWNMPAVK